jgi:hypothetical protein
MDANDAGGSTPRRRGNSPDRQIAAAPVQLPDDLIHFGILARLPYRVLLGLAVVCNVGAAGTAAPLLPSHSQLTDGGGRQNGDTEFSRPAHERRRGRTDALLFSISWLLSN